jgi:hypothetical protein
VSLAKILIHHMLHRSFSMFVMNRHNT